MQDNIRVYSLSRAWKIASLVFSVLGLAMSLGMAYALLSSDSLVVTLIALVCMAGFLLAALYLLLLFKRYRVTIENEIITIQNPLGRKKIDTNDFNAFRIIDGGHAPGILLLNTDNKKKQSLELMIKEKEELFNFIQAKMLNLDEKDIREDLEQITGDQNLGISEEERLGALLKARKFNRILYFFIIAIGVGSLFPTRYSGFLTIALCIAPYVLLLIVPFSKGLIKFSGKVKSAYPSIFGTFIIPFAFLLIKSTAFFGRLIDWSELILPSVLLTLLLFAVYIITNRKEKITKGLIIGMLFFCLLYAFSSAININSVGKQELTETYTVKILKKRVSGGRSTSYYFTVTPWGRRNKDNEVETGSRLYRAREAGDSVTVNILKGNFNIRYYAVR